MKGGAIDGSLGAAGALVTPYLTNVAAMRLLGGSAATLSNGRFAAANAASGAVTGFGSGVAGTGIELGDDLHTGRISLGDYLIQAGISGGLEGGFGGLTGAIPLNMLFNRGLPAGRSMFEGPGYTPFAVSPQFTSSRVDRPLWDPRLWLSMWDPRRVSAGLDSRYVFNPRGELFAPYNRQAPELLPPLPGGDAHVRVGSLWLPYAPTGEPAGSYSLIVQGGSYNFITGGEILPGGGRESVRLLKSFAATRQSGGLTQSPHRRRMGIKYFREVTVGTDDAGRVVYRNVLDADGKPIRYVVGHNVGLVDIPAATNPPVPLASTGVVPHTARHLGTRRTAPITNLNETITDYTPEAGGGRDLNRTESLWGEQYLNRAEQASRNLGGGYVQLNLPGNRKALGTLDRDAMTGTLVEIPDFIVFARTNADGDVIAAWRVDFRNPPAVEQPGLMDLDGPNAAPELPADQALQAAVENTPIVRIPLDRLAVEDLTNPKIGKLHYVIPIVNSEDEVHQAVTEIYRSLAPGRDDDE